MKRWLLIAIAALAFVGFSALGIWQVERRAWKLALIERVDERVHAAPAAAPGPAEWRGLTRENAEYRRVTLTGRWLTGQQTLVRAVTDFGEGFWLMEPLRTDDGFVVLVNRGFVPQGWRGGDAPAAAGANESQDPTAGTTALDRVQLAEGAVGTADAADHAANHAPSTMAYPPGDTGTITGLLRFSEPHGAFLRANAPAENRWYSRDVDAISNARHLTDAAPYFVDAEAAAGAGPNASPPPVAGLTVVHFRNSHLQYAITWFVLALMGLVLGVRVARTP